jgi:nicotinamidase-related amidase
MDDSLTVAQEACTLSAGNLRNFEGVGVALTELDERTALVLIDLQNGIEWMMGPDLVAGPAACGGRLARAFRARGLPVVLVRTALSADGGDRPRNRVTAPRPAVRPPDGWTEILGAVGPAATDVVVSKRQPGAFYGTDLDLQLRRRGVTGIALGGIATSLGVESTARAAYDHGYNITFITDAMADPDPAAHRHSTERIFPALGEVGTAAACIGMLEY